MAENLWMSALAKTFSVMMKSATNAEFSPEVLHISIKDGQDRKRSAGKKYDLENLQVLPALLNVRVSYITGRNWHQDFR